MRTGRYAKDTSIQPVLPKIIDQEHTFEEIRLEVDIKDVSTETLDRVVERQDVYTLAILDVQTGVDVDHISKLDAQIVARNLVHLHLTLFTRGADEHGIAALLSSAEDVNRRF